MFTRIVKLGAISQVLFIFGPKNIFVTNSRVYLRLQFCKIMNILGLVIKPLTRA